MDQNRLFVEEKRIERTMKALEKHKINAHHVEDRDQLHAKIAELIPEGSVVSAGGSMTLKETGVLDFVGNGAYTFLDRNAEGITPEEIRDIYVKTFDADVFLTSSNALTENGELYNVDGRGNRVAAMIYGPKKVIVVCGINKIVPDIDAAVERNRRIAAPANNRRLDRKTPCAVTGICSDCDSPDRICNAYTVIARQMDPDRMHVILVDENTGY